MYATNRMRLKQASLLAFLLTAVFTIAWEYYWREHGRTPNIDDNKDIWAIDRAKLKKSSEDQIVFVGSSRILFDIQKPIWRKNTNTDPIMLGIQGSTPLPQIKNLLEESQFRGTIIVGVTPDIFFWAANPKGFSWNRAVSFIDYYSDRTPAQRINHYLSRPLQTHFAFYRDGAESWDDDVDLKTLLKQLRYGERGGPQYPPFYNFENTAFDRNVEMSLKAEKDTALAHSVIKAWGLDEWEKEIEDEEKYKETIEDIQQSHKKTVDYFLKYSKKYVEAGGKIILVRCPSAGQYRKLENRDFPREQFWDSLVLKTNYPAYHFEDYPQLTGLNLPELSHLTKDDSDYFTEELIKILQKDGHIPKPQN